MKRLIWISQHLQLSQKGCRANSAGIIIAIAGVALALSIMICTVAIVLGFKNQITDRIIGFEGQISVLPPFDYETGLSDNYLEVDSANTAVIFQTIPNAQISKRFRQPGILKTNDDFAGVYVTGFDDAHDFKFQTSNLLKGIFPSNDDPSQGNNIVISSALADKLNVDCGETIFAYFMVDNSVKTRKFLISGIYDTGFNEYDQAVIYAPIRTLQRIADADSTAATQIDICIDDLDNIDILAESLQYNYINKYHSGELYHLYPVDNVKHTGAAFFSWLELLDTNVVVIFILMGCIAAFTLVSSLFIIILNRIPTIGILRALGATKMQIRLIFVNIAMKAVGIGIVIGNIVALSLLFMQKHTQCIKLDPEMYYLNAVPVQIDWSFVVWINLGVIFMSWLVLILPSRMAANIDPASTMRFE